MKLGVHLPQFGRAAGPEGITLAARQAEALGFDHIWVSDHLGVPESAPYPPAFMYEPIVTLTWAAAVTKYIQLGTSILVIPYRRPLHLAKELASLDRLSNGRLIVGAGPGWLKGEFDALGVPFSERGIRTDEGIAAMRACWTQRVVRFSGQTVNLAGIRVIPQPENPIPIWVGGGSKLALARALRIGNGWHGIEDEPAALRARVEYLRRERPEDDFIISNRFNWDGSDEAIEALPSLISSYEAVGVQELIAVPGGTDVESHLDSVRQLASRAGIKPRSEDPSLIADFRPASEVDALRK
jgi:probable F420-dependent oxidoreductase